MHEFKEYRLVLDIFGWLKIKQNSFNRLSLEKKFRTINDTSKQIEKHSVIMMSLAKYF